MKKKKSGFVWKIVICLSLIIAIFTGGYFFLDKKIVPKYFGRYGINGVPDLVGVVSSLYNSPKESQIVTNGHTQTDFSTAVVKLQKAGYKINDDGSMQETVFKDFQGDGKIQLTDKELAAICNKFLQDGILIDALPDLNYLNIINISILEVKITPDEKSKEEDSEYYTKANLSLIMKIDTKDIREQIAEQMQTPIFLLDMIIPDELYFSISYDIEVSEEETITSNGLITINGRNEKQSKVLIDLLIEFIFPDEDDMNKDKFTNELGSVIVKAVDVLGDFKFAGNFGAGEKQNGVVVNPFGTILESVEIPETEGSEEQTEQEDEGQTELEEVE